MNTRTKRTPQLVPCCIALEPGTRAKRLSKNPSNPPRALGWARAGYLPCRPILQAGPEFCTDRGSVPTYRSNHIRKTGFELVEKMLDPKPNFLKERGLDLSFKQPVSALPFLIKMDLNLTYVISSLFEYYIKHFVNTHFFNGVIFLVLFAVDYALFLYY